jgi:serine protease Do
MASMTPLLRAVVRLRIWKASPGTGPRGEARSPLQARNERGFLVDAAGYVVTDHRAVSDAGHIEVLLDNGRTLQASLVARDPLNGVAILKIPATGLPAIALGDSRDLVVGEQVLATGPDRALTAGRLRATGRATGGNLVIDLPPAPAARGGPLLNRRGQAVGILTSDGGSADPARSMSFAVPIDRVKAVLRSVPVVGSAVPDR